MEKIGMKAEIEIEVTDNKTGHLLDYRRFKMDSFVDVMAAIISAFLLNLWSAYVSIANQAITTMYHAAASDVAGAGDVTKGIVVGTGNTAYDHSQYLLVALIAHGTGSGQLSYGAEIPTPRAWAVSKWTFSKYRVLNNTSGGTITVKEVGIYGYNTLDAKSFMMARDVLVTPVALPDSSSMKVTYSFELVA
jgi:hypothetical protein